MKANNNRYINLNERDLIQRNIESYATAKDDSTQLKIELMPNNMIRLKSIPADKYLKSVDPISTRNSLTNLEASGGDMCMESCMFKVYYNSEKGLLAFQVAKTGFFMARYWNHDSRYSDLVATSSQLTQDYQYFRDDTSKIVVVLNGTIRKLKAPPPLLPPLVYWYKERCLNSSE